MRVPARSTSENDRLRSARVRRTMFGARHIATALGVKNRRTPKQPFRLPAAGSPPVHRSASSICSTVSNLVVRVFTAPLLLIAMATAAAASSSGASQTANTSVSPNAKWNDSGAAHRLEHGRHGVDSGLRTGGADSGHALGGVVRADHVLRHGSTFRSSTPPLHPSPPLERVNGLRTRPRHSRSDKRRTDGDVHGQRCVAGWPAAVVADSSKSLSEDRG